MKGDLLMIYTEKTKKAMNIAYTAHNGQKDKSGVPYVFHPIHLAEQMETEAECIVALLHDVVEDNSMITFEYLSQIFSEDIIHALRLLTHDKAIPYMDYIKNLKSNSLARKVKLADLEHNSDITRLENPTQKDINRWEKYRKAKEILVS